MENIIQKIREIYPVSDEALQALQANMELRYYPKDTYIVQSGVTDRLVYFIEEGIARSVFHHNGQDTTTWFTLEGDITFGMDSLYYQQPSVESIETLSDCKNLRHPYRQAEYALRNLYRHSQLGAYPASECQ